MPPFSRGPPFDVGALGRGRGSVPEKEIPEKIRKTVSRRNGIIVLLRAFELRIYPRGKEEGGGGEGEGGRQ